MFLFYYTNTIDNTDNYNLGTIPDSHLHIPSHSQLQQHPTWVLDIFLHLHQELHGFPSIQQTVIISQSKVHHRSDHNLTVYDDWLILDGVESEDCCLWEVDDWGSHQ